MQTVNAVGHEKTWIALNQALGGIQDFDDRACVLTPEKGNVLAIESEADGFRVSVRKRTSKGLADEAVWCVSLDENGWNVLAINDVNGKAASSAKITELNDTLWRFHRQAVEDTAAVIRN